MIAMRVIDTDQTEEELFYRLVSRGRHADIPYYFSVEQHNWEEGWVIFDRLDCAPSQPFRVAVAGSCLLVSEQDVRLVKGWLQQWRISCWDAETCSFSTTKDVWSFIQKRRQETGPADGREKAGERVRQRIAELREAEDQELMARVDTDRS